MKSDDRPWFRLYVTLVLELDQPIQEALGAYLKHQSWLDLAHSRSVVHSHLCARSQRFGAWSRVRLVDLMWKLRVPLPVGAHTTDRNTLIEVLLISPHCIASPEELEEWSDEKIVFYYVWASRRQISRRRMAETITHQLRLRP